MSHHIKAISLALIVALVPVGIADGKRKRKPKIQSSLVRCNQTHVSDTEDDFEIVMRARAKRRHREDDRAVHAALPALKNATFTVKLDGPYVTDGEATGKTNAKGLVTLKLVFAGPGDYTLSWTAKAPGYRASSDDVTLHVAGPANQACEMSDVL